MRSIEYIEMFIKEVFFEMCLEGMMFVYFFFSFKVFFIILFLFYSLCFNCFF